MQLAGPRHLKETSNGHNTHIHISLYKGYYVSNKTKLMIIGSWALNAHKYSPSSGDFPFVGTTKVGLRQLYIYFFHLKTSTQS